MIDLIRERRGCMENAPSLQYLVLICFVWAPRISTPTSPLPLSTPLRRAATGVRLRAIVFKYFGAGSQFPAMFISPMWHLLKERQAAVSRAYSIARIQTAVAALQILHSNSWMDTKQNFCYKSSVSEWESFSWSGQTSRDRSGLGGANTGCLLGFHSTTDSMFALTHTHRQIPSLAFISETVHTQFYL